jgi:hypothetical protein
MAGTNCYFVSETRVSRDHNCLFATCVSNAISLLYRNSCALLIVLYACI